MKIKLAFSAGRKNVYANRVAAVIAAIVALIVCAALSVNSFAKDCASIRDEVLRLHIIANSDSTEDQRVKLLVRDALLEESKTLLCGVADIYQAQQILESNSNCLKEEAEAVLKAFGFGYKAEIELRVTYFTTRSYGKYTLPAGNYLAVRVILGEGKGHNWWCVMFPPLCLPAAQGDAELNEVVGENGERIIESGKRFEMKFKIVEWIENRRHARAVKQALSSGGAENYGRND